MIDGYKNGRKTGKNTCYAYVGEKLAELQSEDATIRFWGIKSKQLIVHSDLILPDNEVYSTASPSKYKGMGFELVDTMNFDEFKKLILST